jgi:hypothetical protein
MLFYGSCDRKLVSPKGLTKCNETLWKYFLSLNTIKSIFFKDVKILDVWRDYIILDFN